MKDENPEPFVLDKPRSGTKRPFNDRSATSQAQDRQDLTSKNEGGLILSCDTINRVTTAPSGEGDVGRYPKEVFDSDSHIEKRPRTSDWPLRSVTTTYNEAPSVPRAALSDRYDALNSVSPPSGMTVKIRPSKFVEGSMNDRASQRPHPWYIKDHELPPEQFEAEQNFPGVAQTKSQLNGLTHHTNRSVALSVAHDNSVVSRPSSIFRFGRSVAAACNPSSWKIWPKQHEEDTQDKQIPRERHEKAEKIYKELKRTGQFSGSAYENHLHNQDKNIPPNKHEPAVDLEHRSSRIDGAHRTASRTAEASIEEKRYGRIYLEPPSTCSFQRGESPASEISTPLGNSSFQSREAMLKTAEILKGPQALRRLPSRKDLQKQQKLVKRVSDLEGKLEAARRQLAEALGEPVPVQAARISRSRFTPRILASLPSERLLGVYKATESNSSDVDASVEVGKALSIGNRTNPLVSNDQADNLDNHVLISPTSQWSHALPPENTRVGSSIAEDRRHAQEVILNKAEDGHVEQTIGDAHQGISENLTLARQITKRRKSIVVGADDDGGAYGHALDADDDDSSESFKPSIIKRGPGRPRKLQKVDPEPKSLRLDPVEAKQPVSRTVMEANSLRSSHARMAKSPKDRRAVLSKKAASSVNNSLVPRKGRYSLSPPPPKSSSGTTYTGQEVSAGRTAEGYCNGGPALTVVPSVDVPPVPDITGVCDSRKALSVSDRTTSSGAQISIQDGANGDQERSQAPYTDMKNSRSSSKQAFEWPADVF